MIKYFKTIRKNGEKSCFSCSDGMVNVVVKGLEHNGTKVEEISEEEFKKLEAE